MVPSGSHRARSPRAVEPAARLAGERIGDEALRRQPRPVEIAPGHAVAADVELARHPDRRPVAGAGRGGRPAHWRSGRPIGTGAASARRRALGQAKRS